MSALDGTGALRPGGSFGAGLGRIVRGARARPALTLSLLLLLLVVALAVFAPLLPYDAYRQNILHRNEVPSLKHWLGTDELGRDMVARIAVGARVSLIVAVTATLIAVAIGVMVGMLSAYIGGVTDGVLMRFVDSMYAFPDTLFAILMAALIKGQLSSHISGFLAPLAEVYQIVRGTPGCPADPGPDGMAHHLAPGALAGALPQEHRICAGLPPGGGLRLVHHPHASAAECGARHPAVGDLHRAQRHPARGGAELHGVGVDPPTPSWGTMIASGTQSIQSYPHLLIVPALAIGATLLALNVIGDALRDLLDPALRGSRRA